MTAETHRVESTEWWSAGPFSVPSGQKALFRAGGWLLVAAVYLAAAKLGLSLAFVAEQVSAVWPPTGIALAAVLLLGYQAWPGILLGAFLANATANEPMLVACGIAIGNTLEAVIGAWLLRRVIGFDNALERVRDAIGLILLAAGLSTMVSATIGVTCLCLGREFLPALQRSIVWSDFGALWRVWWLGDAMGALVVAPPLLAWATCRNTWPLHRPVEAAAMFVALLATCWLVFFGGFTTGLGESSLTYVVFPFVIWSALRFSQPVTTAVTLVASSATIWATLHSLGPFGGGTVHERLLLLQGFMVIVAVTALLLGAALAERKRAETALKEAGRRKDEFLATLAHELRNPLAPIRTGIDLMRLGGVHDPKTREVLDMLDRQLQQITRLVDDLLDVSRVTRGKVRLQLQSIDLLAVVARAVEMSQPLLNVHSHQLEVTLPAGSLLLRADPARLAQVFSNLLNNAAKYSEEGGHITLAVTMEDDEAVVRVRDKGHGITNEMLQHIFDLFVQDDRSLTRSDGGLGIGLTLVRSLVEMHGGTVQVDSEGLGKGSEFVVRLPLASEAQVSETGQPREDQKSPETPRRICRILVVDDNRDAARTLELLLKTGGHQVAVAHTGPAALEAVVAQKPEVVLLDIGLPEIDGYEVARRIRVQRPHQGIVLIAVTGWGQPEDRQRALDAGFDHHLTKPVNYAVLTELLGGICEARERQLF
jgi:signal transduction histidine kinase/ActR/RegA family two-component response regulator